MRVLIGVDDTDNLGSRGTGFHARQLGRELETAGLARVLAISRHQFLVSPEIPYTSHNSGACLVAETPNGGHASLIEISRAFLIRESAEGADAGLCVAPWEAVDATVQAFGRAAKERVLTMHAALVLALEHDIFLEGLTGTRGGVIGALAAVGLRAEGNDGRLLWLPGLRELRGIYTVAHLFQKVGAQAVTTQDGRELGPADRVDVGPWPRAVMQGGKVTFLVEEAPNHEQCSWQLVPKEIIHRH